MRHGARPRRAGPAEKTREVRRPAGGISPLTPQPVRGPRLPPASLPDDLDQDPLGPAAVELAVEDLLPRAEVELPLRHRDHHLAAHDLALVVRVGVVLAGAVVPV